MTVNPAAKRVANRNMSVSVAPAWQAPIVTPFSAPPYDVICAAPASTLDFAWWRPERVRSAFAAGAEPSGRAKKLAEHIAQYNIVFYYAVKAACMMHHALLPFAKAAHAAVFAKHR